MAIFKHDCDKCVYLGQVQGHDLYTCVTSIVLRNGNDGPEYLSIPKSLLEQVANHSPLWAEAKTIIDRIDHE